MSSRFSSGQLAEYGRPALDRYIVGDGCPFEEWRDEAIGTEG